MDDRIREIRYALGDVLGPLAPASMVRPVHSSRWIFGLLSLAAAAGVCFAVVRMYDRRLGQLVDHAMAERRQRFVRENVPEAVVERLPSDEAAIREASEVPVDGVPESLQQHRAATETAGGSL